MKQIEQVSRFRGRLLRSFFRIFGVLFLLIASHLHGQAADPKMSISRTNAPLKEIFQTIEKQSPYLFMYEADLLQPEMRVTVRVRDAEIQTVMEACLKTPHLPTLLSGKIFF